MRRMCVCVGLLRLVTEWTVTSRFHSNEPDTNELRYKCLQTTDIVRPNTF